MIEKYPSYIETAINWTPSVPSHWRIMRGKRFFYTKKELNKGNQCTNVLSLTLKGVINNDADRPIGLSPQDYATYQIFEKDNLVFKLIDLENISTSRVGLVPERGIMSSAYIRLVNRYDCNIKYFYFQYYDLYLRHVYNGLGAGVRSTLNATDLLDLLVFVPPRAEQDQIVRFLDWKISSINKLIGIKKKQIKLIKESREVAVSELVFGKTNSQKHKVVQPLAGIEIPEKWVVIQNKRIFKERTEHTETGKERLLSVSRHYGVKPYDELDAKEQYATIKPALSLIGYKKVCQNDLVMNIMRAQNGSYGIAPSDGIVSPAYCVYEPIQDFESMYIHYLYKTPEMINAFSANSYGIVEHRRRLYPDNFLRMFTVLPPVEEQKDIVDQIEIINGQSQDNINILEKQVVVLQELKTRLIHDVVSGKVDVRRITVPDFDYIEELLVEDNVEDIIDEDDVEGED